MKQFHKNEVLIIFVVLIVIFCQMFFSEYFNVLDDFEKSKNNVVYQIQLNKYKDIYMLKFLKNYGVEYLDKVTESGYNPIEYIEFVNDTDYISRYDADLNGELYGRLDEDTNIQDLQKEIGFALSLDSIFKDISEKYGGIESIYYTSANNFVFSWPKSTMSLLGLKYTDVPIVDYDDVEIFDKDIRTGQEINIFDKDNNYYGAISYTYNVEDTYSFLDNEYDTIIKGDTGEIIYTNIDNIDEEALSLVDDVFDSAKISEQNAEVSIVDYKYYYVYNFNDGTQLLQFVPMSYVMIRPLLATLPIVLIGISYVMFLMFKISYEQSTEKLNEAMDELDESYEKLKYMANTDFLTNMLNRAGFTSEVESFLKTRESIVFVIADIDKFKSVNDTYGHELGDTVLKEFSNMLKKCITNNDAVGRWGGEEFVIAFTNTSEQGAYNITNEIRKKILEIQIDTGHEASLRISASFGVAVHEKGNDDFISTISKADEALYYSKENGRNRVTKYSDLENSL